MQRLQYILFCPEIGPIWSLGRNSFLLQKKAGFSQNLFQRVLSFQQLAKTPCHSLIKMRLLHSINPSLPLCSHKHVPTSYPIYSLKQTTYQPLAVSEKPHEIHCKTSRAPKLVTARQDGCVRVWDVQTVTGPMVTLVSNKQNLTQNG